MKTLPTQFEVIVLRKFGPVTTPVAIGASFRKYFGGHGVFQGKVISIDRPIAGNSQMELFKVVYDDGDGEELTRLELEELLAISPELTLFELPQTVTSLQPPSTIPGCPALPPASTNFSTAAVHN